MPSSSAPHLPVPQCPHRSLVFRHWGSWVWRLVVLLSVAGGGWNGLLESAFAQDSKVADPTSENGERQFTDLTEVWLELRGLGASAGAELGETASSNERQEKNTAGDANAELGRPWALGRSWEGAADIYASESEARVSDASGTYRILLGSPHAPLEDTVLLEVDGAATAAEVRWAGHRLGTHLGGWTPFRVNLTQLRDAVAATASRSPEGNGRADLLEIDLEERVGHNTQGFLPIVIPHFGGIWKHVRLIKTRGSVYIDDLTLLAAGFEGTDRIRVSAQLRGAVDFDVADLEFGYRILGPDATKLDWQWEKISAVGSTAAEQAAAERMPAAGTDSIVGEVELDFAPPVVRRWSPGDPFLYQLALAVRHRPSGQIWDRLQRRVGIRHFESDGRQLLINGEPVNIRGVLNWGYAPPRSAPSIDREDFLAELRFAKERGFNLMKFCLWIPPREYLELADEMGMLTWIEYPTWHPDFSAGKLAELRTEFNEFFYYDRNTVGAILRSLTCETGHGASVEVIRELYDLGHEVIPNAIIEDDSSWIGWHRVHDFYDDHPYGNNHTWLDKLASLDAHIRERDAKPLVLGEAIAADTWDNTRFSLRHEPGVHDSLSLTERPAYAERVLNQHGLSTNANQLLSGTSPAIEMLQSDSERIALLMRKYQMEAFRWRLPDAGYVVSVIRDFPKASMGLIDREGNAKWSPEDFVWHGPHQLVLSQGRLQRSVPSGATWEATIDLAGQGELPAGLMLDVEWSLGDGVGDGASGKLRLRPLAESGRADQRRFPVSLEVPPVARSTALDLRVVLTANGEPLASNQWRLWAMPAPRPFPGKIYVSGAIKPQLLEAIGIDADAVAGDVEDLVRKIPAGGQFANGPTVIATRFEPGLLDAIKARARCLMLPDGSPGSLVTRDHWFLRGSVVVASEHPLWEVVPRELFVDLQTFDLAGPVLFEFGLLEHGRPIASLWDNHDLDYYRTHGLLWEAALGEGSLCVSTLNHGAGSGAAGPYLLSELLRRMGQSEMSGENRYEGSSALPQLPAAVVSKLQSEVRREQQSLVGADWQFRRATKADLGATPTETNLMWLSEDISASAAWEPIEITAHWDGQGYGDLDGWGFYRAVIEVPERWRGRELHLGFTGVDDYFDAFVDGEMVGSGGDIAQQETAFELRTSFVIPGASSADGRLELGVRVYDWYGAGGVFRPVYLATEPLAEGPPLIMAP